MEKDRHHHQLPRSYSGSLEGSILFCRVNRHEGTQLDLLNLNNGDTVLGQGPA